MLARLVACFKGGDAGGEGLNFVYDIRSIKLYFLGGITLVKKSIEIYVRGTHFMKGAVKEVLVDRKGASTVEYVAVLAGAAALGAIILTAVQGEKGVGATLIEKIKSIVDGI